MEQVTVGSKTYDKAAKVAKQFKYTTDYVGQLCRSGKIDAQLVGRAWYVNVDSVKAYRSQKHGKRELTKRATTKPTSKAKKVSVSPVLRTKTIKTQLRGHTKDRVKIRYIADDHELAPTPVRTSREVISLSSVTPIKITVQPHTTTPQTLTAEDLPEVSLTGKLAVEDAVQETPPLEVPEPIEESVESKNRLDDKTSIISSILGFFSGIIQLIKKIILSPFRLIFSLCKKVYDVFPASNQPTTFTPKQIQQQQAEVADVPHFEYYARIILAGLILGLLITMLGYDLSVISGEQTEGFSLDFSRYLRTFQ